MKLKLKCMLQPIVSRHACSHLYKRVVDVHVWLNESSATNNILSFRWRRVPKYNDKHREKNQARKRQHFAHRSHCRWRRHAWYKDAARIAWLHGFEYSLHEVVTCVRSQSIREWLTEQAYFFFSFSVDRRQLQDGAKCGSCTREGAQDK